MPDKPQEVKPFDPNEGAGDKSGRLPNFDGIKAVTVEQYISQMESATPVPVIYSDTISKAMEERAKSFGLEKAVKAPPDAYNFGRANIMPDPSSSEGVIPWPGFSPDAIAKIVQENVGPQLIIGMRCDDVIRYSVKSTHPWKPGWHVEVAQGKKHPTKTDLRDIAEAELFLENSNLETGNRDARARDEMHLTNFQYFLSSTTRDSLTYDGIAIWTDTTNAGWVKGYKQMPAAYIRLVDQKIGFKGDKNVFAVLLDQGGTIAKNITNNEPITFTRKELVWYTRNPRVDPFIAGYGYPEVEIGVRAIQGLQNAIDMNCDTFNRSSIPNGMLVLKGGGWVQKQLDVLMRMWNNLKKGISKVWALPVIATPPDGDVAVLNLNDLKGTDARYQDHMNMMIGLLCTIFRFPTHRLGYRVSGKGPDTVPLPDSQVRILDEDDPGLTPLLTHLEQVINQYLIWPRWPNLQFVFTGKSPKEDAREYEFRKNAMTLGEARAETDLRQLEELAKTPEEKFLAKLMTLCPLDPNQSGVFQTVASALVKATFEGSDKDGDQPGNRMVSNRDPAKTEAHGHMSGVRRPAQKSNNTLYVHRPLENAAELVAWAHKAGFAKTLALDDLHVTIAFSRDPVDWGQFAEDNEPLTAHQTSRGREVVPLGDKGAVVLKFRSRELQARWQEFRSGGCSWDHESYQPHITITYDGTTQVDLTKIEPYTGELVFGAEVFGEVQDDWDKNIKEV